MKPTTLRLGNIVKDKEDGTPMKITSGDLIDRVDLMEPIKLTRQWVECLGLPRIKPECMTGYGAISEYTIDEYTRLAVCTDGDDIRFEIRFLDSTEGRYYVVETLNELQNYFYYFTTKELEIDLSDLAKAEDIKGSKTVVGDLSEMPEETLIQYIKEANRRAKMDESRVSGDALLMSLAQQGKIPLDKFFRVHCGVADMSASPFEEAPINNTFDNKESDKFPQIKIINLGSEPMDPDVEEAVTNMLKNVFHNG